MTKENHDKHNNHKPEEPKPEHPKEAKAHPETDETITILKKEYDELLDKAKEADALNDKFLRAHAEFENARRRIEKDKSEFMKYANEGFILDFLPILDSLEMSEKHIKEAKDFKAVQEGVDMIHGQIQKFVKDIGVERVKALGEKFDPHFHEAVETEEAPDKEDGLITAELKPGYRLNGKLLRPAMVKIVKRKENKDPN
jgi:molecular chaperone GrpE